MTTQQLEQIIKETPDQRRRCFQNSARTFAKLPLSPWLAVKTTTRLRLLFSVGLMPDQPCNVSGFLEA